MSFHLPFTLDHYRKLSILTAEDVVFWGVGEEGLGPYVLCSDTFAWGTSDGEDITPEEVDRVAAIYALWGQHGLTAWVCVRRRCLPFDLWLKKYGEDWQEIFGDEGAVAVLEEYGEDWTETLKKVNDYIEEMK